MKTVNLSRRPFVNRRPIIRLGIALWVLGGLLVLINVGLFQSYWADSSDVRAELEKANGQVAAELQELEALDGQIDRVDLATQNSQAVYLNSLISYRTFPWSALFDDLERVTPFDVRLESVTPAVRLLEAEAAERAKVEARQEQANRRRGRRGRRAARSDARGAATATDPDALASDEVRLQIRGIARTEDALIDFVDTLYGDDSFRQPVLSGERFENVGGALNSSFEIKVVYLTGARDAEEPSTEGGEDVAEATDIASADAQPTDDDEDTAIASAGASAGEGTSSAVPSVPIAPPVIAGDVVGGEDRSLAREESRTPAGEVRELPPDERPAARETPQRRASDAASERRRRIEELRQRRRDSTRRSRSGVAAGRPPAGGFLGTADGGGETAPQADGRGEAQPETRRGSSRRGSTRRTDRETRRPERTGAETPASGTPRVQGSLIPGLPEWLDQLWPGESSPWGEDLHAEDLEELG